MTPTNRLKAILPAASWTEDPDLIAPHLTEWRGLYEGRTALLLMPETPEDVAHILKIATETKTPIAIQGGNTGLTCAGVPDADGSEILLSLKRMNKLRHIDPANYSVTVEAGMSVQCLQDIAADHDRLFPLSLASEGTCTLGGVISTNAGGVGVLRYGTTRDLVLGLEVVLPTGEIWNGLRALRKDNTGYDLKHFFIGAEGTLGVVTAATMKLFPKPAMLETALIALPSAEAAIDLFARARDKTGDQLTAFELIPSIAMDFVLRHIPDTRFPFQEPSAWYVLAEAQQSLAPLIETAIEDQIAQDAVIAQTISQAQDFWKLRESISAAQKYEGSSIKHDVSVPVSRMADFITRASAAVKAHYPDARPVPFGHVGDGNVHFNIQSAPGADRHQFEQNWEAINRIVHDIVIDMQGSISAEHGIGRLKRAELAHYAAPIEISVMRQIKASLDPANILNPGRVIEVEP